MSRHRRRKHHGYTEPIHFDPLRSLDLVKAVDVPPLPRYREHFEARRTAPSERLLSEPRLTRSGSTPRVQRGRLPGLFASSKARQLSSYLPHAVQRQICHNVTSREVQFARDPAGGNGSGRRRSRKDFVRDLHIVKTKVIRRCR